jgi:hypothetical protein
VDAAATRIDGLMLFRAFLAAWLLAAPWLLGGGVDPSGLSDALVGVGMLVVAFGAARAPSLRWLQAALGLWLIFSAVLLEPSSDLQRYDEILLGKLLLLSAPVTRELFTEPPKPPA